MRYRHAKQMGGVYFSTVVTYDRKSILTIPENIQRLREAFLHVMQKYFMDIEGIVILPDHYNPVKHGYVEAPGDWPYNSFSKSVKKGWYPQDWGRI